MKRKILSIISVILVLTILVPVYSLAAPNQPVKKPPTIFERIDQKALSQIPRERILQKRDALLEGSTEILELRRQAADLVKEILDTLRQITPYKDMKSDPTFIEIKAVLDEVKNSVADADVKAKLKDKYEQFKKDNANSDFTAAENAIQTLIDNAQTKIDTLKANIVKLQAALQKAKDLVANSAALTAEVNEYKKLAEQYKRTLQDNHLAIVKAEIAFRGVNSKIIATVSANKDVFTTDKLTELKKIMEELKALKDELHKALKNGVKDAINKANALRKEGKFDEAINALKEAIALQETKKTALANATTKAQAILDEINALIGASAATSSAA